MTAILVLAALSHCGRGFPRSSTRDRAVRLRCLNYLTKSLKILMVPHAGVEPALLSKLDFESSASTNSANGATDTNGRLSNMRAPGRARRASEVIGLIR